LTSKSIGLIIVLVFFVSECFSQDATLQVNGANNDTVRQKEDTVLRIRNLNPYFTLHVDSTLIYKLEINKDASQYFWFLKNSPIGLRVNKDNGLLSFKAEKSYFLSGKLKYDNPYKVSLGVQSLNNPNERVDTSFTIVFFTTDIIPSHVKPTVSSTLFIEEGDTISFKLECEEGSFPIQDINFLSNIPIKNNTIVKKCDDDFTWSPPYDFVRETDSSKQKLLILSFVGTNKFLIHDTAVVRIFVKDALNYPVINKEFARTYKDVSTYVLRLKYAFVQLDRSVKKTKSTRTTFDLTTATTALSGTVLSSESSSGAQNAGKILPSAGLTLVPVKETVAPQQTAEQNSAALIRSAIKRLQFTQQENSLSGEKDLDILKKIATLKNELKQTQIQLIDVPIDENTNMTEEQLNAYFDNPKVNKKYRLKNR
jgi:hypothetical protein